VAFTKTSQSGRRITGAAWTASAENTVGGSGGGTQTITATGIASAEAFGTAQLDLEITGAGAIASAEAFGSPTLLHVQVISPTGIASAEAFGTPAFSGAIGPSGIISREAFGTPVLVLATLPDAPGSIYRIYINGILRNDFILKSRKPISISLEAGSFGSCKMAWFDPAGATRPLQDEEVIIIDTDNSNLRIFGGLITKLVERFYTGQTAMEIDITCAGWGVYMERRVGHKFYTTFQGGVASILLASITRDFLGSDSGDDTGLSVILSGSAGGTIGEYEVYAQKVSEAFRTLMRMINADFWVDHDKVIQVFPKSTGFEAAPFTLTDDDGNFESLSVERNVALRANRIYVKNSRPMKGLWIDSWAGDEFPGPASGTAFPTTYFQVVKPIVKVNSVVQIVVLIGDWSVPGWQWYYISGGTGVFQNLADAPLGGGDTIEIIYPSPLQFVYIAEDTAAIAADGLWEAIVEGKDLAGFDEMKVLGDGELLRKKTNPIDATAVTRISGVWPGQLLTINTSQPLLDDTLVVKSVRGTMVKGKYMKWTIKATNSQLQKPDSLNTFMAEMIQRDRQPVPRNRFSIHIALAEDIDGSTNPGLVTRLVPGARTVEESGWIREWHMGWETGAPFAADISIDIKLNGTTIFPATKAVYEAGDTGIIVGFTFVTDNLEVARGDKITAESLTTDSTAKNGWLDLIIEG